MKWASLRLPWTIRHSPAWHGSGRYDESWLLDAVDAGKGLTTFPTERRAMERAEELFGPTPHAVFTITLLRDRTLLHVRADDSVVPEEVLSAAMAALQAERDALDQCPRHVKSGKAQG